MTHQTIEVKRPVAMEDYDHSAFWLLNKHFQCLFNEFVFGLHAIHAVAKQYYVESFVIITCAINAPHVVS